MATFNNINFIQSKLHQLLILVILGFAFLASFDPEVGRYYAKYMSFLWLLTPAPRRLFYLIKYNRIFQLILAFTAWALITNLISEPETATGYEIRKYFRFYLLPILVISSSIEKKHIPFLVKAFITGMLLNEIISYSMHFGLLEKNFLGFQLTGDRYNPIPFLTSHIEYTTFLAFSIIISIFTIINSRHWYSKTILTVFAITMTINMFITNGRTGQFILISSSIILLLIYFRHKPKLIVLGVALLAATFTLGYQLSPNVHNRAHQAINDINRLIHHQDLDTSWGIRISSYLIITDIIERQPFYGFGFNQADKNTHEIQLERFGSNFQKTYGQLHNTFINILASTGFVGLFIFILTLVTAFRTPIESEYFSYIRHAFLLTIIFNGVSSTLFWEREVMLLSSIFLSIIIVSTLRMRENDAK